MTASVVDVVAQPCRNAHTGSIPTLDLINLVIRTLAPAAEYADVFARLTAQPGW